MGDDEFEILRDIESYTPSVQNINVVINVIAVLHVFSGVLAIPIVYLLFSLSIFQAPVIITITILIVGAVLISSIPINFIIGWAIWSLQSWAWKVAVITNVIILTMNLIGGIILLALLNIVYLIGLLSSDVKLALSPLTENSA